MQGSMLSSGMDIVRLTKNEILDALNHEACRLGSLEDRAFAQHFHNQLVKFNFAALGEPDSVTPEEWNGVNDPPPELCTIH